MGIWTPSGPSGCAVHHSHQVKSLRSSSRAATRRIGSRDQDAGGVAVLSLVRSVSTSHNSPPHRARLHFAHLRGPVDPESLDNPATTPAIRHSWALLPGPATRRAGQPHQARPLATRERIDARATVETMTGARLVTVLCADAAMQRTLIARHCVQESPNHCHPLSGLGRSLVHAGQSPRARSLVISEGGWGAQPQPRPASPPPSLCRGRGRQTTI